MKLSIIIPVFNESVRITQCLIALQSLREQGHEIVVVDGGSDDDTLSLASPLSDILIKTKKSRAIQMNTGAAQATGECLLFLHVDTFLPANVAELFFQIDNCKKLWGRFDIKLSGTNFLFRIIETCMNVRSRLTGIMTGDQVLFISRELFSEVGGFPEIALMEDITISKKLLDLAKPVCLKEKVLSSSRRWEKNGIIKTVFKMWLLRLLYFFNFDINKLARMYS